MPTYPISRHISILLVLTVAVFGLLLDSPSYPTTRAQDPDSDYEEEFHRGRDFFRRRKYEEALKSFKRANEMREKKSAECYAWMADTYFALDAFKNVVEASDKVIEFANGDTQLLLKAYNNKGRALLESAERKDQKKLQAAEAAFRQALAIEGAAAVVRYNLGVVLMQLNRDEEGIAEMKQYMKSQPNGPYFDPARRLAENPRRARESYAPDFSFVSSEGEHIALEDLRGKVVVLDFWGTWCPPCVESVPELRSLHKRYSKEPSFMLIGISSDSDEEAWREFTARNKMVWPQYRDRDRRIQNAFGVRAFPTYIVIDHEGIVRYQSIGTSWVRSANLDDAIKKQVKIVAKSTEAR
jgi:peroxiredoxin/Tfp pilus assembly protein PilF